MGNPRSNGKVGLLYLTAIFVQQSSALILLESLKEALVIGAHTLRSLTNLPAIEQEARVVQLTGGIARRLA